MKRKKSFVKRECGGAMQCKKLKLSRKYHYLIQCHFPCLFHGPEENLVLLKLKGEDPKYK